MLFTTSHAELRSKHTLPRHKHNSAPLTLGAGMAVLVFTSAIMLSPGLAGELERLVPAASAASIPAVPASHAIAGGVSHKSVDPSESKQPTFEPPAANAIPKGPMGDMIRKGEHIFLRTGEYAKPYVGNALSCVNCHSDAGRLANAAPLWAAYVAYPAYRSKNKHVNDYAERLQGCFKFSMNGKAPERGSEALLALEAYSYWMATGAPTNHNMEGRGYVKLPKPAEEPDYLRGQKIYADHCALCHAANGAGQRVGDTQVFPPLWGEHSFNWGAGMGSIKNAAGFIKANMPFSRGDTLTDQEAWDVAAYMDSHERPQDPRFDGDIASTRKKFHDSRYSKYGTTVNGKMLGEGSVQRE